MAQILLYILLQEAARRLQQGFNSMTIPLLKSKSRNKKVNHFSLEGWQGLKEPVIDNHGAHTGIGKLGQDIVWCM